jgi:hypothetical protein
MPLALMPVLARHDVERIHEHSLDLLERVGVVYKLYNHQPPPLPPEQRKRWKSSSTKQTEN